MGNNATTRTLRKQLRDYVDYAPKTIRNAFERTNEANKTTVTAHGMGFMSFGPNVNLSDVFSELIRISGRISTSYNSDILSDIEIINKRLFEMVQIARAGHKNLADIITIGIRKGGADSTQATLQQLNQSCDPFTGFIYPERTYHTVLAVEILTIVTEPKPNDNELLSQVEFDVTLKDITHNLYKLDPEDALNDTLREQLSKLKPYPEAKVFTDEEIQTKLDEFYDAYAKYWIYTSKITLDEIVQYTHMNGTFEGIKDKSGFELASPAEFAKRILLDTKYMKTVLLTNHSYDEYLTVVNQLYP